MTQSVNLSANRAVSARYHLASCVLYGTFESLLGDILREFLKIVLDHKKNFIPVKVSQAFIKKVQGAVLEMLNLKDLNQLRDKYEGVAFYNKVYTFLFGMQALETHLGIPLINWKKVMRKDFSADFSLAEFDVKISVFKMGELPVIESGNTAPVVFVLQKNDTTGWICGLALVEDLNDKANQKLYVSSKGESGEQASFIGFDKLKAFNNWTDLKTLIANHELSIR
jgi:hypothetical protein